ncbi:N-acetylglucosamine-6-phosphate deacetylase [Desemzia sp. RIT804]|uniref:N-acetylglucosamine-6-phosphate deacetylase n=1 Tax=Desemzia sp. RIT 804 TaxID=2810209 RepID=UPI00194E5B8D|nr:N-acetylglucosamine-6-phosphate deacetylase [Desemzia sp. RIT 804]MBM6615577.1 N-acetylglucosamine-6-phosphate deacetylase [Desemzia sp. RIT 804]
MANKVFVNGIVFTGEAKFDNGFVRFSKEILAVGNMEDFVQKPDDELIDISGEIIVPGFIDVHSHGGYGSDNMDADPEKINAMIQQMHQEGITSYFPTTMTQSYENIEASLKGIAIAAETNPVIQGIHVEGPFISAVFKGAQPEEYIRIPDAETMKKWDEISGGRIRLVTYAPETSDASEFEKTCQENDIVLSAGHTNATREQMKQAKAKHITHLYNAQRGLHHREPGVTGHAFLDEDTYVEVIADGYHIHPEMVKMAYMMKGPDRIEIITDAMRAKGMPDGESELGGQKVIVKDKQARLESGNLAGSVLEFQDAFKNIMEFTGCGIEDAVKMSSVNQAREFNLTQKGIISAGKDADMVVFDQDFNVQQTISYGKVVYQKEKGAF